MECCLASKKAKNSAFYDKMDKPRRYYAKWNKSDTETQIKYVVTYMCNQKMLNSLK
jgi:hypothetical protein